MWWIVFPTFARPQTKVHLPYQNQSRTLKSLYFTAVPLTKCAEYRVQFAKLRVFCTCKYSLITVIKGDYGSLADGECNVLIRVSKHCNTNRMSSLSEQNGLLARTNCVWCRFCGPLKSPEATCVLTTRDWLRGRGQGKKQKIATPSWKIQGKETDAMKNRCSIPRSRRVASWIRMTSKNILTRVKMTLQAIRLDIESQERLMCRHTKNLEH